MRRVTISLLSVATTLSLGAALVVALDTTPAPEACPPGMMRVADAEHPVGTDVLADLAIQYRGGGEIDYGRERQQGCIPRTGPESFTELALRDAQLSSIRSAPTGQIRSGAAEAAAAERAAMVAADPHIPGLGGSAAKYGIGPINANDPRFNEVNRQGFIDNTGRIDDFTYDESTGRLFAAIGTGGVWLSEDRGASWRPISDHLPSTVISSVAYTPAGGPDGTVVVTTGEHTFGGLAFTGIGVWYSRDLGETWKRSSGPPSDTLGFATKVDPTNPNIIYSATGNGLWRSTDAGVTFTDVVLPTGDCASDYNRRTCNFANFVTDVVVQHAGGVTDAPGGQVVAAVGWRAGTFEGHDGNPQSCCNGIYVSDTGERGTFTRTDGLEAALNDGGLERIGRIELGIAHGEAQDHDVLYAIVEDAVLFMGGPVIGPIPDPANVVFGSNATVLSGVYVSTDLGHTWTLLADDVELAKSCTANQSVFCINGLIEPGIQAWYNLWVEPDPTVQDPRGIPTRLLFGLEEVWQNREAGVAPTDSEATSFEVIGRYYADGTCLIGLCAVNELATVVETVHPDQHDAIFLPVVDDAGEPTGAAELLVGHDGGISSQVSTGPADPYDQRSWELAQDNGLQTLLPYQAAWANDGVAYMGLQDNGHVKVIPEEDFQIFGTIGADGTYAAVDPADSDYGWESIQGGNMNVTTDGGQTWASAPPPADNKFFVNPAAMDPLDANHLVSGGTQVNETLAGPDTPTEGWETVFDLGTTTVDEPADTEQPRPARRISAVDVRGPGTYVGFCGVCDIINSDWPFQNGIATNIGATDLPEPGTPEGWHFASAEGLPNRYITSIAIDPQDATLQTIYVTLGGYSRSWVGPGAANDTNANIGEGHVYKSTDAGETFVDISGDLPDITANWVEPRGDQLLVGMDNGLYLSSDTDGGPWGVVAPGVLPNTPVLDIDLKPDDPSRALIAYYGRGLWTYEFPDGDTTIRRAAGPAREQTAIDISVKEFDTADTVVLARRDVYADALAGAPLAHREDAPILLTPSSGLHPDVATEIERLGASRVILLGGEVALTPQVVDDLAAIGITDVTRFGGVDRFATARDIALEVGGREVYVVEGQDPDPRRGWPDAMSIAPVAAHQQRPILLVTTDRLPDATVEALDGLNANAATIVGGTAAVAESVSNGLAEHVHVRDRIAGVDRYETSVSALQAGIRSGLNIRSLWLARGGDFPDALAAGPTVAGVGGSMVLVSDTDVDRSPATREFLTEHICGVRILTLLGGTAAIAQTVEDQVRDLVASCPDLTVPTPPAPAPVPGPIDVEGVPLTPVLGPFGFEDDAEGWTVAGGQGVPPTQWQREEGAGFESDVAFSVIRYGDFENTTLTSPELEVPDGEVYLTWMNQFDLEGSDFDEVHVELSEDGGETWTTLAELGGQNVGFPDYAPNRALLRTSAASVLVRFRLFSDFICSGLGGPGICAREDGYEGVRIDDVALAVPS